MLNIREDSSHLLEAEMKIILVVLSSQQFYQLLLMP